MPASAAKSVAGRPAREDLAAMTAGRKAEAARSGAPVSCDRFHRGRFEALQPLGGGHRSGSDALLLAAALPQGATGALAELGAGAGVAAFAALTANPGLAATLVEIDAAMVALAVNSLALAANAHLRARARIVRCDVCGGAVGRKAAGLADATFDYLIANPPYRAEAARASPDPARRLAHRLEAGGLECWLRAAAALLRPGGQAFLVWRTERIDELLRAASGRFGDLAILPLHARAGEAAARVVVRATKGSRAPLSLLPGIVLHEADGRQSGLADTLLNGEARLAFPAGTGPGPRRRN
jgi:tRNA1(Val) A37 N6-methylase TrmN6